MQCAERHVKTTIKSLSLEGTHSNYVREAFGLKNVTKSGKSPPEGGGSAKNIKKSKIRNLDFLIRAGGGHIFIFFPNSNAHLRYFS